MAALAIASARVLCCSSQRVERHIHPSISQLDIERTQIDEGEGEK